MNDPIVVAGLSSEPLDPRALVDAVRRADCGGIATFEGTTRSPNDGREVVSLSYEAYEARATRQLDDLARAAIDRWDLGGVVAVHRTGDVPPGEPSVVVAAVAAHRDAAFEAARWLIDTLKAEVAIWKKEIFSDGVAWVGTDVPRVEPD